MYVMPQTIYPNEVLAGCIAVYKNIWSDSKDVIQSIESSTSDLDSNIKFTKAQTLNEANGKESKIQRTNAHLGLTHSANLNEDMRQLNNRYFETVLAAVKGYKELMDIEEEIYFIETFNILKYQTGQEYNAHYDGGTISHRAISPILYLNDDYEGGEIEFVNFNLKIKPEKGTLYIFPSSYPYRHIAHPVTDGTKYAIVTWLHDQPAQ